MKNRILLLVVCTLSTGSALMAQTNQLKKWFIAPKAVDMPFGSPPSVASMLSVNGIAPAQTTKVANGLYDDSGDLLFYVSDNGVYDYNNSLIGNIEPPNSGAEIVIVPFGNNNSCQSKFNIFTTSGGLTGEVSLTQTIVDMKSFSLSNTIAFAIPIIREFGAMALSKTVSGGSRYLYFMGATGTIGSQGGGMIYKLIVNNNGSVTAPTLVYPTTPYVNDGAEVFSRELDLSPDGKYLAWASLAPANLVPTQYRYHFLQLDLSGNYVNSSYQQFNIPGIIGNNISGFRGVEFYQSGSSTKLFLGAGTDGIYYTDIPNVSAFTFVFGSNGSGTNSTTFGLSQIEHSFNGYMYAVSGNSSTGNVGAFDPATLNPSIINFQSFTLTNPLPPNSGWTGVPFYSLPDQIDGQNYDVIVPVAVPSVVTASSYNISSGGLITWTYGSGTNNPWGSSTPVHIFHELRISGNTKLTINGMTFKFSPTAKVIVENGSSLTLDNGAVLTSNHRAECTDNYTWIGVEVWGSPTNQSQNINSPAVVGKLTLKNGSKIENAQWGARAHRSDVPSNNYRGGIIISESYSVFANNKIDVQFLPYQNINNGTTFGNKSVFSNTTFTNDDTFSELFTGAPLHVSIDDNRGIRFIGCTFLNHNSNAMFQKVSVGIKSINSNFSVSNISAFSNLYRAIDAYSTGAQTFSVTNSTFTDNEVAIYINKVNKVQVHQNTFTIGGHQRTSGTSQYGIRNYYGTGFSIQENYFQLSSNQVATSSKVGVQINSAGTAANQIYKNTFDNLTLGNFSTGQNRANSPSGNLQGLQWLCNKNINNTVTNFFVVGGGINSGVRLYQGTNTYPAGNEFTTTGNNFSHFNNGTSAAVTYYYSPLTLQSPVYFNNPQVVPVSTGSHTNSCPTFLCNPACERVGLTAEEISQLNNDYDSLETAYLNMLYTYNQLMDGGNTNALLTDIELSWSGDANVLYNELMGHSPYLSQEILREVALKDILPEAMLLVVCMSNPDATKDEEFLRFLQFDLTNPIPQYMIDLIISSWDDATARTTIENMVATHNQQMGYSSDKLLIDLYFKQSLQIDEIDPNDTTNYFEQINYWLNRSQNVESKYDLAENLFVSGDIETAEQIIESIPVDFGLSDEQQSAHKTYIYFYEFRKALFSAGYSLGELDNNQIDLLFDYTQGTQNFATGMIQNVLCFYYDICRDDNLQEPGNRMMFISHPPNSVNINSWKELSNMVVVSPNPVNDIVTFRYILPSVLQPAFVVICDVTGRETKKVALSDTEGQLSIDVSSFNKGIYYYYVEEGNKKIVRGKITIAR
jgi:hypothetical protein